MSPIVRKVKSREKFEQGARKGSYEAFVFPHQAFEHLRGKNGIKASGKACAKFNSSFVDLRRKNAVSPANVKLLLEQHGIEPYEMTHMAKFLLTIPDKFIIMQASHLLQSASSLDDAGATMLIMEEALKHKDITRLEAKNIQSPLRKLMALVEQRNIPAMMLMARLYLIRGQDDKALKMYAEASPETGPEVYNGHEALKGDLVQAWDGMAMLFKKRRQKEAMKKAYETGAFEHDDPKAYFLLTETLDRNDPKYLSYTLKAAASGLGGAAYQAAYFYIEKGKEIIDSIQEDKSASTGLNKTIPEEANAYQDADFLNEKRRDIIDSIVEDKSAPTGLGTDVPKEAKENFQWAAEWFWVASKLPGLGEKYAKIAMLYVALIHREMGKPLPAWDVFTACVNEQVTSMEILQLYRDRWDDEKFRPLREMKLDDLEDLWHSEKS